MSRIFAICLLSLACAFSFAQDDPMQAGPLPPPRQATILTNDSIIKMNSAGLGDTLIVQTIHAQPGRYTTSADDLIALKKAGVSDTVIAAMVARAGTPTVAAAPVTTTPAGVEDIGVYWQNKDGIWTRFAPEMVNYKSSNLLVPLATHGIVHENQNGHIEGASSELKLTSPVHILLYINQGNEPEEYILLKLKASSKAREFRSSTGGVFHSRTGASQDAVEFTANRIAPHVYEFTLENAKAGEYGIIPPGSARSANAASGGKIYTFHLIE
jgi:hypothetical protein